MVRLWLQALTRKVMSGRMLRRTSRPAWRPRVCPRFDTLESRTLMSAVNIEPPEFFPLPKPSIGDKPPAAAPADPGLGSGFKHGFKVPDSGNPGWDKLLQDVLAGPRPLPGSSGSGLAGDAGGNPSGANTFGAPSGRVPSENLGGNGGSRNDLRAADPLRPRGAQAGPGLAPMTPDVQRPRGASSQAAALLARVAELDQAAGDQVSQSRGPDAAVARAGAVVLTPANPRTSETAPQPGQASATEAPTARGQSLPSPAEVPDGSLLQRYVAHREETAFAALVQRHERLVFGVCRRVLGDSHAALDAFQATFLVLARRANVLDKDSPLAGWLYKVAYHLALRLRAVAARQRDREREAAHGRPVEAASEASAELEKQEMRAALREELQRLPEKHRTPLLLCYFDGHTHDAAARAIGLPRGSMAKRIGEGLELLRERLTDRGFML
ncbi:MAG: sigma-70 family RNA polymerase sigma factor [Gemmataceae bacterium]|nr:sigma-70 family RNA polymerase sigma factor [Gemmataceae bacterium]